jgi:transcriptional regulator GlxA family with amidase domain
MTPITVGLVGFDRVTAFHLFGLADAFSAAALDDGYGGRIACYEVSIVGLNREGFRTESGVTIATDSDLRDAPPFDTIIVPGGPGIRELIVSNPLSEWLLGRMPATRRMGAICTGIYALAPTGLLDGRAVAAPWRFASDLLRRFPLLKIDHKKTLLRDGPIYTANGLTAGLNVALTMIGEDYGPHVALAVESELILRGTARDGQDLPIDPDLPDNHPADRFADLVAWIVRNLSRDVSVEFLARRACMSPRHFTRAFKSFFGETPMVFVENLRLNEAQRRLSKRQKTVQGIATSVGFADIGAFRRAYKRRFGAPPGNGLASSPAEPERLHAVK